VALSGIRILISFVLAWASLGAAHAQDGASLTIFPQLGHSSIVSSVAFAPDGKVLASGGFDDVIKLWDVGSGRELRTLSAHQARVLSVAFSPDGKVLASGGADGAIRLWDGATGTELRAMKPDRFFVNSVVFSPDGKVLASGSGAGKIELWDVASGRELRTLSGHLGR